MTLPAKLGVGALTLGSCTAAGCVGVIYSQQGTAISTLIDKEYQYILLDTSTNTDNKDNEYWKTNWDEYKRVNAQQTTGKDIFQLSGWTLNNQTDLTTELKKKCKALANSIVLGNQDKNYQNVTKYCTRGVTVEEEATKKGRIILKIEASSKDESIWQSRHSKATDLKNSLSLLGITESNLTAEKIRSGCGTAKTKNKKEESNKYQQIYDAYVKVCTKQNKDPSS